MIDEYGDDYIIAHGTDPGNGQYYILLKTPTIDDCCGIGNVEVLTGAITGLPYGWNDCGEARTEGFPAGTGFAFPDACFNYVQVQSSTPFQAKITFVPCG